jgi:hypothetical protein
MLALGLCAVAWFIHATEAHAQPREFEPGSVLVFPFFDARPGKLSIITVTNVNTSRKVSPNNFRGGDVQVHYYYIDGQECLEFNRSEFLTPGDTLSVLASEHNPEGTYGYLYVVAEDPETEETIDYDYLVGDEIVFDSRLGFVWQVPAISFQALPATDPDLIGAEVSGSGHFLTESVVNGGTVNGLLDFDGMEYAAFPDRLIVSSFLQQGAKATDQLILFSPGNPQLSVNPQFVIFNNQEDRYSRGFVFKCFWTGPLEAISNVVKNLGGDSREFGPPSVETGWMVIDGDSGFYPGSGTTVNDPPILGMIVRSFGSGSMGTATLLHHIGTQSARF